MYSVCVREHMMIAHSFKGDVFGPAQQLHGATYVIDVEFRRRELDADAIVVDIGRAGEELKAIVGALNYRNLDAEEQFRGKNTTTEFLSKEIFDRLAASLKAGKLGESARGIESLRVTLRESHVAWAAYEADLSQA